MQQLIEEYREALKYIKKMRLRSDISEEDDETLGKFISNLQYSIEYMQTGRVPGNRRGVHRLSKKQRTKPVDPNDLDYLRAVAAKQANDNQFESEQQEILDDYMAILTHREKEAFRLVKGQRISYGEAAKLMNLSKGTVQYYVEEAERKLTLIVQKPEDKEIYIQRVLFSEVV